MSSSQHSIVQIAGAQKSKCGYCKRPPDEESSCSYGLVSPFMLTPDYEELMLRGWRRSGTYFYQLSGRRTCCPSYTIRLSPQVFRVSKAQRQVVRRLERFLMNGDIHAHPDELAPEKLPFVTDVPDSKARGNHVKIPFQKKAAESSSTTSSGPVAQALHRLTVEVVQPRVTPEVFNLYKKYQVSVHGDVAEEVTEAGFKRFLVDSPLSRTGDRARQQTAVVVFDSNTSSLTDILQIAENPATARSGASADSGTAAGGGGGGGAEPGFLPGGSATRPPHCLGTFHHYYRLDGQLIAVGVVDMVPSGLSSVYLFYDPDMRSLVLGKITALMELAYCKMNNLSYYYMGFYMHTCPKMRYKAEYAPSELLCPVTLTWHPLSTSVSLLDHVMFTPLDPILAKQRLDMGYLDGPRSTARSTVISTSDAGGSGSGSGGVVGGDNSESLAKPTSQAEQVAEKEAALLARFPLYSVPSSSSAAVLDSLRLDVGAPRHVKLSELTREGIEALSPMLKEFIENVGTSATKFVLKFR